MCKHKSGGINKPSGNSSHQGAMNDQSVPTYPSQNGPSRPDASLASTSENNSIHSQIPMGMLFDAESKASAIPIIPMVGHNHLPNETHNQMPNFLPETNSVISSSSTYAYTGSSHIPNSIRHSENSKSDDSEDEDVITELSPMLLGRTFPPNSFPQSHLWKMGSDNGNCYYPVISQTKEGPYILPYISKCANFNTFRELPDHEILEPNTYPNLEKNWLFPENLTSDVNCSQSPLLCQYNGNECVSPVDSNSCMTDTYSSSTMNTDPLPGPSGLQRHSSVHWEIGTVDKEEEEEFRMRSYSLTPTVNFAVFESESASEAEDNVDVFLPSSNDTAMKIEDENLKVPDEGFQIPVSSYGKVFPISPSAAQLSLASSYGDNGSAICKICHMTAKENDPLISPCRCAGTMQYIHCGCLMRWLEISSKRSRKPACCELCQYQYHWHKKFKVGHWQFPHCSRKDKILHFLFFLSMIVMVACATITIMCFKQDRGTKVNPDRTELTQSEIITLVCGVTFFLAFFVAMYVEVKSHSTIYKLLVKFIYLNQQWYIDEYEKKDSAPVDV